MSLATILADEPEEEEDDCRHEELDLINNPLNFDTRRMT